MAIQQLKDEYEILSEIGTGGMATVYKAVQKSLDRPVAIKQLKKSFHGDEQLVRRFERESRVAASLQHENIVHIYDYWKRPTYAIVMEYVDGTNLADIIEKNGPLPVDVGIMIAIQVCSALEYAHMRGLVHRDIKPSNIMIKRNGEVKLMDFGIAHTRHLDALTLPGTLIGTPAYMSPEQILGHLLDVRSDIFSFGIVLYEMFTGIKPFADDEKRPVTARIVHDDFRAPRRVNRDIPRRLQWLIKKCLRKKPRRRYASMLEVERKLGKRLAGRTTKAASLQRISDYLVSRKILEAAPEQETMIIPPKPRLSGRLKASLAVVAALFAASAGAGVYYHRFRGEATPTALRPAPVTLPSATVPLQSRPTATALAPVAEPLAQPTGTAGAAVSRPATTAPRPAVTKKPSGKTPLPAKKKKRKAAPQR
ncbi:MAG TPA: protein kinase [Candidatus Deferrimicrobiaceae bacterium]